MKNLQNFPIENLVISKLNFSLPLRVNFENKFYHGGFITFVHWTTFELIAMT